MAANPKGTTPLRLDEEVREIDAGLQRSKHRDQFVLEQKWAVRPRDIQRAMLDLNPQIVHFSGPGTGDEGLVFEDETGSAKLVDGEALAGLFDLFADQLECVVLNGCYSQVQANAISQHINYVIGMKKAIGDTAAIEFAVGFYDALGSGRPVEFAYKFGCAAIRFAGVPEQLTPILKKKPNIEETVAKISLSNEQPPVKNAPVSSSYQELNDSDREIFTELLIPSGRAEYSAPKALCIYTIFSERCQRELARYIGPMARFILEDTLAKHPQIVPQQLVELLSNEIPNPQNAKKFKEHLSKSALKKFM